MSNVGEKFEELVRIMAQLRGPSGCPWDKEQTPLSAVNYIIEEAFETVEAIELGASGAIKEELGDLLLQIVLQSQMVADTTGEFTIGDVIDAICQKLIVRHPHVFGEARVCGSAEVLVNWEKIKSEEKPQRQSILDGLPKGLPSLLSAYRVGQKASRVGFDWKDVEGILNKIEEEAKELHAARTADEVEAEFGDLLFTLANLGRFLKVDPETALRKSLKKFTQRFQWMEAKCKEANVALQNLSDQEWDALWNEAKMSLRGA